MLDNEIDHEFTVFPVCPNCGFEDQDWWDGVDTNQSFWDDNCPECRCKYRVYPEYCVEFCTKKIS